MKLNLVPKHVKKGGNMVFAWVLAGALVLLSLGASAFLAFSSSQALEAAKNRAEEVRPRAEQAVAQAKLAQSIADSAKGVVTNVELSKAMAEHNTKYTRFYRLVNPYVPGFLRLTNMTVSPISATSAQLDLSGVLYSLQQFNDAQVALLRIPGAVRVSASGYAARPVIVPALNEEDQYGRPSRVGSDPLPLDPTERLNAIVASANDGTQGFENLNGYGTQDPFGVRGAINTGSPVTFQVLLDGASAPGGLPAGWDLNFLVPDIEKTLRAGATAGVGGSAPNTNLAPAALSGEAAARAR